MKFTAHNVKLADGRRTIPEWGLLSEDPYCQAVLRTLRLLVPPGARVADLGCLEGGFSVEFAKAGYDVTGIEGREANYEKCQFIADNLKLSNLSFKLDDVRNVAKYPAFDAVFCAGVLYHLDRPVSFLQTLGEVTRRLLIVQTHYALPTDGYTAHSLSPLTLNEGKMGRWFPESEDPWASIGNSRSFWLTKSDLLQSMLEGGFPMVCEQYDFLGNISDNDYIDKHCRSLFLGIKAE